METGLAPHVRRESSLVPGVLGLDGDVRGGEGGGGVGVGEDAVHVWRQG